MRCDLTLAHRTAMSLRILLSPYFESLLCDLFRPSLMQVGTQRAGVLTPRVAAHTVCVRTVRSAVSESAKRRRTPAMRRLHQ